MAREFDGIQQKLQRTQENVLNLESEVVRFFNESDYPVFSKDDKQLLLKQIEYHRNRPIPLRFAVLAGEIVHHLRSCFDHVAWLFSSPTHQASKDARFIEFPILEQRPTQQNMFTSYERKIQGIADARVRDLIEKLQPYNATNPRDSFLRVIHNLDVADKHKELVIMFNVGAFQVPMDVMRRYANYASIDPVGSRAMLKAEFERHGEVLPEIAFRDFFDGEIEPVVQGLMLLFNFTVIQMKAFDQLSP